MLVLTKFPHSWVFGEIKIGVNLKIWATEPLHLIIHPTPTRPSQPLQPWPTKYYRCDRSDHCKIQIPLFIPTTTANPNLSKPNFVHLHKPLQNPFSQYPLPLSSHPAINISISLLCNFFLIKTKQLYSII